MFLICETQNAGSPAYFTRRLTVLLKRLAKARKPPLNGSWQDGVRATMDKGGGAHQNPPLLGSPLLETFPGFGIRAVQAIQQQWLALVAGHHDGGGWLAILVCLAAA